MSMGVVTLESMSMRDVALKSIQIHAQGTIRRVRLLVDVALLEHDADFLLLLLEVAEPEHSLRLHRCSW